MLAAAGGDAADSPGTAGTTVETTRVARSALVAIDAVPGKDSVELSIHRVRDQSAVISNDVSVSIDGKNEPVTRRNDGSYEVSTTDLRGDNTPRTLEVIVGHDGIREVLTGKVTFPEASGGSGLFGEHKQIAWWILNIIVVFVAVIALSRRKS